MFKKLIFTFKVTVKKASSSLTSKLSFNDELSDRDRTVVLYFTDNKANVIFTGIQRRDKLTLPSLYIHPSAWLTQKRPKSVSIPSVSGRHRD